MTRRRRRDGSAPAAPSWTVVVPTVGRPSLDVLLGSLAGQRHQPDGGVLVVDDRRHAPAPLDVSGHPGARVVAGAAAGPAAARNAGRRAATTPWVVFVDDDVELPPDWSEGLLADLAGAPDDVAAVQGRIRVPRPQGRRLTDWERTTAGLETAAWITADMAVRARALEAVGGFDERFPRAYREDADLALRLRRAGWQLRIGSRSAIHPVRPASRWVSLRQQRGNADDALMRRLHGPAWRREAVCPRGRMPWHLATLGAGGTALAAGLGWAGLAASGRAGGLRRALAWSAAGGGLGWLALTGDFARRRIAPGPRTASEVATMAVTSALIPPLAVGHRLAGTWRWRDAQAWHSRPAAAGAPDTGRVRAVLFDRDGTLVHDVPYNGDPDAVGLVDGAVAALAALREAGLRVGLVTNQSGIGRGLITRAQAEAVNARLADLVGGFDTVQLCPHRDDDGCACRKPAPGMVLAACHDLGLAPSQVLLVGDIGADVAAAEAAGARGVLVPTPLTRHEEVAAARIVATDLREAVDLALRLAAPSTRAGSPRDGGMALERRP